MRDLTERQKEILAFIGSYISSEGRSPTQREIGDAFGFSHAAARDVLIALERKGCIEMGGGRIRAVMLAGKDRMEMLNVPVPFFPSEPSPEDLQQDGISLSTVYIPRSMAEDGAFAFRVHSESMKDGGILPGDTAVMRRCTETAADSIVLASFGDDAEPMELRRYRKLGPGYAELWPENDSMGIIKIPLQGLRMQAVLVAIRRDYRVLG